MLCVLTTLVVYLIWVIVAIVYLLRFIGYKNTRKDRWYDYIATWPLFPLFIWVAWSDKRRMR